MRSQIFVALLASSVLHAGVITLTPIPATSRDSARPVFAAPQVITARLENTFVPDQAERAVQTRAAKPATSGGAVRTNYSSRAQAHAKNPPRFYPVEAIAQGLEGEAVLMLRFGANGALVDAQVVKSSGHAILDEAALRAARATQRLASGPREMLFPVTFALR
jgi:protein TonB